MSALPAFGNLWGQMTIIFVLLDKKHSEGEWEGDFSSRKNLEEESNNKTSAIKRQ